MSLSETTSNCGTFSKQRTKIRNIKRANFVGAPKIKRKSHFNGFPKHSLLLGLNSTRWRSRPLRKVHASGRKILLTIK